MEAKDWITLLGIGATLIVAGANLVYNMITSRRTTFVNAVTTSRVKWIETVRERVATLVGLTHHWPITPLSPDESQRIIKECDVLRVLIELCLNPTDPHDQNIIQLVRRIPTLTGLEKNVELHAATDELVHATQLRLKTEWQKVKREARGQTFDEAAWLQDVMDRTKRTDSASPSRQG